MILKENDDPELKPAIKRIKAILKERGHSNPDEGVLKLGQPKVEQKQADHFTPEEMRAIVNDVRNLITEAKDFFKDEDPNMYDPEDFEHQKDMARKLEYLQRNLRSWNRNQVLSEVIKIMDFVDKYSASPFGGPSFGDVFDEMDDVPSLIDSIRDLRGGY